MKIDKSIILSFVLLVIIASLYRIMPGRPYGFAPQIAMALFGGSIVAEKKFAFILPLFSMFISDVIYEVLYSLELSDIQGFYDGQVQNYLLIGGLTIIGFWIKKESILHIGLGSLAGATVFFILSNFLVWAGGGLGLNNLPYPKTFEGLMSCFAAGLLFYKTSIYATLFFSGILFGGYYIFTRQSAKKPVVADL